MSWSQQLYNPLRDSRTFSRACLVPCEILIHIPPHQFKYHVFVTVTETCTEKQKHRGQSWTTFSIMQHFINMVLMAWDAEKTAIFHAFTTCLKVCFQIGKLNSKIDCYGLLAHWYMLFILLIHQHFTSVILSECDFLLIMSHFHTPACLFYKLILLVQTPGSSVCEIHTY